MQKPDGLVVIEEEDLPEILFQLKLRDFCGIGAATGSAAARLRHRHGRAALPRPEGSAATGVERNRG